MVQDNYDPKNHPRTHSLLEDHHEQNNNRVVSNLVIKNLAQALKSDAFFFGETTS